MKRNIAFLLITVMLFSLLSCNGADQTTTEASNEATLNTSTATEATDGIQKDIKSDYGNILDIYVKIAKLLPQYIDDKNATEKYAAQLGITDENEKQLFGKLLNSSLIFYDGRGKSDSKSPHYKLSYGYSIKDLNGDGINELVLLKDDYTVTALFSISEGQPVLLGTYMPKGCCKIDGSGSLHIYGSGGAGVFSHTIYKIANGGQELEKIVEFGANGIKQTDGGDYSRTYYKLTNGKETSITEQEYQQLSNKHGKHLSYDESGAETSLYSGLRFIPLFKASDIATEMYEAAVDGTILVADHSDNSEKKELSKCFFPYTYTMLSKAGDKLTSTILDLDDDGINEMVISVGQAQGDSIILRYDGGVVSAFALPFRQLYYLNTDGSFSWNSSSYEADFIYGESKMIFEGGKIKAKELWRIENDGEPNARYYIEYKEVTKEELDKYIKERPTVLAEFSPLKAPWIKPISLDDALKIAWEHWGISAGDVDKETGFPFALFPKNSDAENYFISLSWLVDNSHYSTLDTIEIDAYTGEIVKTPTDGKG